MGWRQVLVLPSPSTVVTCAPWRPRSSWRLHEVTVTSSSSPDPEIRLRRTVQEPQEPSPHDNLVPVRPEDLRYWTRGKGDPGEGTVC